MSLRPPAALPIRYLCLGLAALAMLVGLVALAGQWWVESHNQTTLTKPQVAAHLVNLAWNGMRNLQPKPVLRVAENPLPPVEDAEWAAIVQMGES